MKQWSVYEIELVAAWPESDPYLQDNLLTVAFSHPSSGTRLDLAGFWDGGRTWRVRFAPTLPGQWEWQSASPDIGLDQQRGTLFCTAPTAEETAENPNLRGHVGIASTGRYLVYADGSPFFLLADTLWAVNTARCSLGQGQDGPFYVWLHDRRAKGYTAALIEFVEMDRPNEGGYPFPANRERPGNGKHADLNPQYFQALDRRIRALWEAGFVIAGHPTWIGKRIGLPPAEARRLSRYLLARYGAYNLIWSLSGEYQGAYVHPVFPWSPADWHALGEAVQRTNPYHHPVSIHPFPERWLRRRPEMAWPPGADQDSSGGEFREASWLDHNWLQTGQSDQLLWRVPMRVAQNYAWSPPQPVIHVEGLYENNTPEGATAAQVRWQAWVAFLNGAAGHGYGAGGLFQFYDPLAAEGIDAFNSPPPDGKSTWREALAYPGGTQLKHLADFFSRIPWWTLEPHPDWLRVDGATTDQHDLSDPHCAANPGQTCVVYIPEGSHRRALALLQLERTAWKACWFNPRDGSSTSITDTLWVSGGSWAIPDRPDSGDWVLQLTGTAHEADAGGTAGGLL